MPNAMARMLAQGEVLLSLHCTSYMFHLHGVEWVLSVVKQCMPSCLIWCETPLKGSSVSDMMTTIIKVLPCLT